MLTTIWNDVSFAPRSPAFTSTGTETMPSTAENCSALFTPRSTPRKGILRFGAVLSTADTDGEHVVVAVTVTREWWLSRRTTAPVARTATAEGVSELKLTISVAFSQLNPCTSLYTVPSARTTLSVLGNCVPRSPAAAKGRARHRCARGLACKDAAALAHHRWRVAAEAAVLCNRARVARAECGGYVRLYALVGVRALHLAETERYVAIDTRYTTLESVPNSPPKSTDAVTNNSAALQPACTVNTRPSNVAHAGLFVLNEVRASEPKVRLLALPLTGSTKSTSAEKVTDDGTSIPFSVAMSPSGARVSPAAPAQAFCAVPLTCTPLTRTAFGSGSCRKSSTSASVGTPPHGAHCAASSMPHSRTAPGLTLTDHTAASLPIGAVRTRLDVRRAWPPQAREPCRPRLSAVAAGGRWQSIPSLAPAHPRGLAQAQCLPPSARPRTATPPLISPEPLATPRTVNRATPPPGAAVTSSATVVGTDSSAATPLAAPSSDVTSRTPDSTRSRVAWYEPSTSAAHPSSRLSTALSSCSESGAGCHTRSVMGTERPFVRAVIVAVPPVLAAAVPTAVQPSSVSTALPASLVHVAVASELSGSAGRLLTERTITPLLTSTPVSGAVFCSQVDPPAKLPNKPATAAAFTTTWPVALPPSRPSSTSASCPSTKIELPKLDIEATRSHTADACVPSLPDLTVKVAVAIGTPLPETDEPQSGAHSGFSTIILRLPVCCAQHVRLVTERDGPRHQLVAHAHQAGADARGEAVAHVQRRAGQRQCHAALAKHALHWRALQRHATHRLL
eukprot:scaffold3039_cov72-Phaeocystis_antarctica.AAC.2